MPKAIDLTNEVYNYLTVIKKTLRKDTSGSIIWKCECTCGNTTYVSVRQLRSNNTQSCGCKKIEAARKQGLANTTHGASFSYNKKGSQIDYSIWSGIKRRCYNKNDKFYYRYGGRGIKLYKEWINSFEAFASYIRTLDDCPSEDELTTRGKGKVLEVSLDRIDNNKHYKPNNLKWSTQKQQTNNRRTNKVVVYNNTKYTLAEACEKYAVVNYHTAKDRLQAGWSVKDALLKPSRNKKTMTRIKT